MVLSNRLIRQYQNEYQRKFGKDISPKDAEKEIFDLKELVRLIAKGRKARHGK